MRMSLAGVCGSFAVATSLMGGCGDDELNRFEEPEPKKITCWDGSEIIEGEGRCPAVPGAIAGQVCDRDRGEWLEAVTVSVTTDAGELTDLTDENGAFLIENVPPGSYYVHFLSSAYENDLPAFVESGQTAVIGPTTCSTPAGHLKGRVCNETTGLWVNGATVTLDNDDATSTTTDQFGRYQFLSLMPGGYTLTIDSPTYTGTRSGEVYPGQVTDLGPTACVGGDGTVEGRICGGEGYWLSDARVYITFANGGVAETTTDTNGDFTLTGVPAGTYTVQVRRGSFEASFQVTVTAGGTTTLPEPVCIPPTTQMAVVTGDWDEVEHILGNLGFSVRSTYNTPTPQQGNPEGNIDLIKGIDSDFWVNEFLGDAEWLAQYDIIFFNCGVADQYLTAGGAAATTALTNLQDFVSAGGSVYASDWASEVVRLAFPGHVNFYGSESTAGAARVGNTNYTQAAEVLDNGLEAALGRSNVTINFNLPYWVVVDKGSTQPQDLHIMVRANVSYMNGMSNGTLTDSPIIMQFGVGQGRVLYTSAHNEGQNTPDLQDILNYIVFEL